MSPWHRLPTVLAAWLVVVLGLGAWLAGTPDAVLRRHLGAMQFWWLEFTFWAVAACFLFIARGLRRDLRARDVAIMAGLASLALAITLLVAPRTNRIYYDEQIYQGIGQNLADTRRAQMCNDGTVEYGRLQCWSGEYNKQPYAYPHLLSLGYRLVGVREGVAFAVNAIAVAAAPVLLYALVLVLFADRDAAAFAGLVLTLTPHQAIWGATAAVEPAASLACVLALVAAAWFCRTGQTLALAATVVTTAYAVQFRIESVLVIPAIALMVWQHRRAEFGRSRFWWLALLGVVLLAAHLGHLHLVRHDSWGSNDARLSLRYLTANLRVNGAFYLADERYPALFTLAALGGLFGSRCRTSRWPMVVYFFGFFLIGLLFYAGSYNYGADVRYSVMTYPPLSVLAGFGLAAAATRVEGVGWAGRRLVAAALLGQALLYAPVVRATTEEAWAARSDVRFAAEQAPWLRGDQYVLTHNPSMFHLWGVNAGQISIVVANPSHLEYLRLRYPGGVYLHWNFWCNVQDQAQRQLCSDALALQPAEAVRRHVERDQHFAFYRFAPHHVSETPPGVGSSSPLADVDLGRR